MIKKSLLFFLLAVFVHLNLAAQGQAPKREMRGAWIATVANLDWPSIPNLSEAQQRAELLRLFDELHEAGINAVFLQIRPESDALYRSEIEPWSYWLTGKQGSPPNPFYDPLEFAIDEAHERGMELHAWFNPYRAVRSAGAYPNDSLHVSIRHPEWLLTFGAIRILDPGLPEVREYITSVIMDVVRRYDIDGVHFDDFFYPYPPNQIAGQDLATFQNHNRGFSDIGDWRRDNVNLFVEMVYDSIKAIKAYVKFGISPFGIWKNGEPAGIVGLDAYNVIYADPLAWLGREIVDYVAPQLYWPFGGGQDYGALQPWWASQSFVRHIYIGQAVFKIMDWPSGEMQRQLALNRSNPDVSGSLFFRALFFRQNHRGFTDYLRADQYRYLALPPQMPWKDAIPPGRPQKIRYERIAGTGTAALQWDMPETAADGDTASRFVLYRFETANVQESDLEDPAKILAVTHNTFAMPEIPPRATNPYFYVVAALDRISNESEMSAVLEIQPPTVPLLAFPADAALNQPQGVEIAWHYPPVASSYHVQVSQDSMFSETNLIDEAGIVDTVTAVFDMQGQQTYFWRVNASNAGGTSEFSARRNFTTGFPMAPVLALPADKSSNTPLDVTFRWHPARAGLSYRIQISRSIRFEQRAIVADVDGLSDTTYVPAQLGPERTHFWRVRASNAFGNSLWSEIWQFKTGTTTGISDHASLPVQFELLQNYPNPFNPATTIEFSLPKDAYVQLRVYDILGREIQELVERQLPRGQYSIIFNGSDLPSGVYHYRLIAGDYIETKKMALVK